MRENEIYTINGKRYDRTVSRYVAARHLAHTKENERARAQGRRKRERGENKFNNNQLKNPFVSGIEIIKY